MEKISGIYKITNTVTGDFYIGSSKDVKHRWKSHKWLSTWNEYPNNPMYHDMQKYGTDKFEIQILEEIEIEHLKEAEQQFIENMKPTYNSNNAKGWDVDRYKKQQKEYQISGKYQDYNNQLCSYNGKTLTLAALSKRFQRAGIKHCVLEAKKYLLK